MSRVSGGDFVKKMNVSKIKNFLVLKMITKKLKRKKGLACPGLQSESPPRTLSHA